MRGRGTTGGRGQGRRAAPDGGAIGILGGTFDPVHWGHLAIGESAREALGLSRVLFVPAARPPHKPGRRISRAEDRIAMLEAATADNPSFSVSRIEADRGGPSYTLDTLLALGRSNPGAELWFILSTEALAGLPEWHEPERVLDAARLAVVPRAGRPAIDAGWVEARFPGRGDRVRWIDGPAIDVSASDIRARAAAGRSIRYLVPPAVEAYITHHGLYTDRTADRLERTS
ncbi:MAG TPA: nicotinate-nucleotide adenylyltransferase [Candidatus Limnocylindrales bacterium]|nr:nicotinate-nucleotide adenylyltransferase [Candidatus Limnocylindrales bacterium]